MQLVIAACLGVDKASEYFCLFPKQETAVVLNVIYFLMSKWCKIYEGDLKVMLFIITLFLEAIFITKNVCGRNVKKMSKMT